MFIEDIEYVKELFKILFEKGILTGGIIGAGYLITKSIERIKINESFKNEITKTRVQRITKFYDLYSEYEHWLNKLILQLESQINNKDPYLTKEGYDEATINLTRIHKLLPFELNQMRFWINNDIYYHTVGQLELLKEMNEEILQKGNVGEILNYRFKGDQIRMNLDTLLGYLNSKQNLKHIKYDRSFLYKK